MELFKKVVVKKVGSVKKAGGSVCHGSVRGTLPVQKHQGYLIPAAFWLQGHLTGTKSSGALWILLNLQNPGNDRETEDIG